MQDIIQGSMFPEWLLLGSPLLEDVAKALTSLSEKPHYTFVTLCYIVQNKPRRGEVKMAVEELQVIRLRDDFYRDGFYKILFSLTTIIIAILFLIAISLYLFIVVPPPISFVTDNDWRILPPVPVTENYPGQPDLIQWVSEVIPRAFTFDFVNYTKQMESMRGYFTANGWKKYQDHLNQYANANTISNSKQFLIASPAGAPFILNQGILDGRYSWWIQMPININYITLQRSNTQPFVLQILVVRIPTLDNLDGLAIENMIITQGQGDQVVTG